MANSVYLTDTLLTGGVIAAPGSGVTIAFTPGLAGGSYDVVLNTWQEGTLDTGHLQNMLFWVGGNPIGSLPSGSHPVTSRLIQLTVPDGAVLAVKSNAAAAAGCFYVASLQITRLAH